MDLGLTGKEIVVTGGAGALGRAILAILAAEGAHAHAPSREELDLADEAAVTAWYAARPPLWGSIHAAGGFAMAKLEDTTLAAWRAQHELNAVTSFLCSREAVRAIRRGGGGGRIVNVVARAALSPPAGMVAYVAAKAAVVAMTQALAAETRDERILVNAVAPSLMDTPLNRKEMPQADFSRWPTTTEVARTIVWLASPASSLTSGAVVPVYGLQ